MQVNCESCGKVFYKKPADIKRTKYNVCSKKCTGDYRSRITDEKFWDKCDAKENNCWEWNGSLNRHGYGVTRFKKKLMLAHRAAYMLSNETNKIPDELLVCHRCDNPKCVNPDHLFLGTHQDNMTDMVNKGRKRTKLTFDQVKEIRQSTDSNSDLAKKYSVPERTIRYAKNINNWQSHPNPPKEHE